MMEREDGRPEAGKGEICRGVRSKSKGACESCSFVQGLLNHAQYLTRYLGFGGWRSVWTVYFQGHFVPIIRRGF
jgi:hypothetical protein